MMLISGHKEHPGKIMRVWGMQSALPCPHSATNKNFDSLSIYFQTGYYMYIEASRRKKGDNAKLEIKPGLSGKACISFFYNMRGGRNHMGILRVLINGREVFVKSGHQGNNWLKADITSNEPVSLVRMPNDSSSMSHFLEHGSLGNFPGLRSPPAVFLKATQAPR